MSKILVFSAILCTHRYSLKGKRSCIRHGNTQWVHTYTFTLCCIRAITPCTRSCISHACASTTASHAYVCAFRAHRVFLFSRIRNKLVSDTIMTHIIRKVANNYFYNDVGKAAYPFIINKPT